MSIKCSQAAKKTWSKLSIHERRERMKPLIDARWKRTSKASRKAHAVIMAKARWDKIKKENVAFIS